jgi:hypothetical protein
MMGCSATLSRRITQTPFVTYEAGGQEVVLYRGWWNNSGLGCPPAKTAASMHP